MEELRRKRCFVSYRTTGPPPLVNRFCNSHGTYTLDLFTLNYQELSLLTVPLHLLLHYRSLDFSSVRPALCCCPSGLSKLSGRFLRAHFRAILRRTNSSSLANRRWRMNLLGFLGRRSPQLRRIARWWAAFVPATNSLEKFAAVDERRDCGLRHALGLFGVLRNDVHIDRR